MSEIDLIRKKQRNLARHVKQSFRPFKFPKASEFSKKNRDALADRMKEHGHIMFQSSSKDNYLLYIIGLDGE